MREERWGTWEELILGGAVLRHGSNNWDVVAFELRSRTLSPFFFTPKVCKAKYEALQERYSGCSAWFEELRKRRVEELRRSLEMSEDSIGSLESKLVSLKADKVGCNNADYSCSLVSPLPIFKSEWNESSVKEGSKDGSSAGSFTHETETTWSKQSQSSKKTSVKEAEKTPVVLVPPRLERFPSIDELAETMLSEHGVSIKKRRGKRRRKDLIEGSVGENNVISSTNILTSSQPSRALGLEFKPNSVSVLSDCVPSRAEFGTAETPTYPSTQGTTGFKKRRKEPLKNVKEGRIEEGNVISSADILRKSLCKEKLVSDSGQPLTATNGNYHPCISKQGDDEFTAVLESIMENEHASIFRRRLDSQKRARYRSIVRRHMDLDTVRSRITSKSIKSMAELLRDLLLIANNALIFYSRFTREYKCALVLRDLVTKKLHQYYKTVGSKIVVAPQTSKSPVHKPPAKPRSARPFNRKPNIKDSNDENKAINVTVLPKEGVGSPPSSAESSALTKKSHGRRGKVGRVKRGNTGIQAETPMKVRKKSKEK